MEKRCNVTISDDYAHMVAGIYTFYFGYEKTVCPDHGNDANCRCEKEEWAFLVEKDGKEIGRLPASQIDDNEDDTAAILLRGISRFGNKFWR